MDIKPLAIGTTSPLKQLQVSSSNTNDASINVANTSTGGRIYSFSSSGSSNATVGAGAFYLLCDETSNAYRMVVNSAGNVGIGTTAPAELLNVNGDGRVGARIKFAAANANAGRFPTARA